MAGVHHALYLLRSYYFKLFSDCSCPLMLNGTFIVLGSITDLLVLSGSNLREKKLHSTSQLFCNALPCFLLLAMRVRECRLQVAGNIAGIVGSCGHLCHKYRMRTGVQAV